MKFFNFDSIAQKLALLVMLSVLPALLIILYSGVEQRRHSMEIAKNDALLLVHSMAETQKGVTSATRQILSTLAKMPAVQGLDARGSSELFRAVTEQNPEYLGITLTDTYGNVLASNRAFSGINLADRKHIRDALARKDFAVGEYIVTRVGEIPSFAFAFPVLDREGEARGVLAAVLRLDRFSGFFDVSNLHKDSFVAVTDHKGIRLFYHPAKRTTNPVGKPIRAENWEIARKEQGPGKFILQGSDGVRRIFAFEQVRLGPGEVPYMYAWAGIPEGPTLRPANAAMLRNLLLLLLATVLALAISRLVGRITLLAPIKSLVETTHNFASGDLEVRNDMADRSGELGTLARAFNEMADCLARSQAMLLEREAHLEEAQRIAHIGSWEWDALADTAVWSKELCRIVGIDPCEPVPSLAEQEKIYTPESTKRLRAAEEEAMKTGKGYGLELESKQEDGTSRWLLARGEALRDGNGAISGLRGTALDITERKLAEQERVKLQEQLGQAQKMESIGRLAGGVAHDFNNMLAVILGHTDMVLTKLDPGDPIHAELQLVRKAASRSADLVRQLLAFARKQIVAPQVLDLNETVEAMLKMLRRLIGENIELAWLPGAALWRVKIDPSQVDQILANLCVNARDAIDGVGKVTLRTENVVISEAYCENYSDCFPGKYVLLAVGDTGSGMDQETLTNLFEPFFTTKEQGKGTGLGLATVYGSVKQNSGFIHVDSEPGKGTNFRIYLPRVSGDEMGGGEDVSIGAVPPAKGETVLLVEDEPMVMDYGKHLLITLGYKVLTAATPKEAIGLAEKQGDSIDLLLTDVIMPEMNGGELAGLLMKAAPNMKCLFMSGYSAEFISKQGVLDKEVLLIQKPFTKKELAVKIRKALEEK